MFVYTLRTEYIAADFFWTHRKTTAKKVTAPSGHLKIQKNVPFLVTS